MLIWMRDSAFAGVFKLFFLGMLVMAVGGLVLMDVGGFFTGNMASGTIVKGGGVNIGATDFNRTVERALSRQGISARDAYRLGMVDNILKGEIQNRLFVSEAHKLGFEIKDEDVLQQISQIAAPMATEGRSKKEVLQQILRTQGISESEFIGTLRTEMATTLLRGALMPPPTLTSPLMAQTLYRYDQEKRGADIVLFKNTAVKDVSKPTEDQIQKFYEANKSEFLVPETRTVTMATLKTDMLKKNIVITDEQLKAEYDKNIASFTKPSRRVVEQIVLKDEAAAKAAFAEMNAGKMPKNTMTQEYEQSGLLPEIGAPVFAAKKDAVIGPIKTDLGWHVIKVKETLPEKVTPFADMKDSLKRELESIALTDELFRAGNTIEDRVAAGDSLEDLVKEYGMTTEKIGPFRDNGKNSAGEDAFKSYAADKDKLIMSAYDYEEGEVTPLVETADGQFHLLRIDTVKPDSYRDFASVKGELEKRWISEQQRLATQEQAKTALESLNGGMSAQEVAKTGGGEFRSISAITRKGAPPAPLTSIASAQIFGTEKGKGFMSQTDDGIIVGTVTNISLPSASVKPDEKELTALSDLTGASLAQDTLGQYINGLTAGKKIKINQATLKQMYGDDQQQVQ